MRVIRAEQLTRSGRVSDAGLERHCVHTAACEIAGVTIELCSDLIEVAQLFALRYAEHPAAGPPDFRYYVATVRGGYAFWCAHAASWRWTQGPLPPDAVAFLADAVAFSALVQFDARLAAVQGAGVEFNGMGAVICGNSVAGKAATLLACVRRGMRIYSDERALLREKTLHPFLRRSSVRTAGARMLLGDQIGERAEALGSEPCLSLRTCFGSAAVAKPHRLRAFFSIIGNGHCAALELADTAAVLPSLTRTFEARGDMVDRVSRAISALRDVRCYKLTLGNSDESAAAIAYALSRMGA